MNRLRYLAPFVFAALSASLPATAEEMRTADQVVRWQREDLAVYRTNFLAVDRSFTAEARAAAEARLARMEKASKPLTPVEFAVELCRVAALADNAHTQCMPYEVGRIVCERFAALVAEGSPWCNLQEPDFKVPGF